MRILSRLIITGLITGAAQKDGFKGSARRFDRRNLLVFDTGIEAGTCFARAGSGLPGKMDRVRATVCTSPMKTISEA